MASIIHNSCIIAVLISLSYAVEVIRIDFTSTLFKNESLDYSHNLLPVRIFDNSLTCGRIVASWNSSISDPASSELKWHPDQRMLSYLIKSKLWWIQNTCHTLVLSEEALTFQICINRFIAVKKLSSSFEKSTPRIALHISNENQIFINGTLAQTYVSQQPFLRVQLLLLCTTQIIPRAERGIKLSQNAYLIYFQAPAFCDWSRIFDKSAGILLSPLENWCTNFTDGERWTYEYCHPSSLYRISNDGITKESDPFKSQSFPIKPIRQIELLGYNSYLQDSQHFDNNSKTAQVLPPHSSTFPLLRSPWTKIKESGDPAEWTALKFYTADISDHKIVGRASAVETAFSVCNKPLAVLVLPLQKVMLRSQSLCCVIQGGDCERKRKKKLYYSSRIIFTCDQKESRITEIVTVSCQQENTRNF